MRVTKNRISQAIKEKTGLDIKVFSGNGCFHFYSDDEETALMLAGLYTTTIDTCYLSNQSVEGWVQDFEWILADEHQFR